MEKNRAEGRAVILISDFKEFLCECDGCIAKFENLFLDEDFEDNDFGENLTIEEMMARAIANGNDRNQVVYLLVHEEKKSRTMCRLRLREDMRNSRRKWRRQSEREKGLGKKKKREKDRSNSICFCSGRSHHG
jgi:hypothetical protein